MSDKPSIHVTDEMVDVALAAYTTASCGYDREDDCLRAAIEASLAHQPADPRVDELQREVALLKETLRIERDPDFMMGNLDNKVERDTLQTDYDALAAELLVLREALLGGETAVARSFTEACQRHMNDDVRADELAAAVQDWLNEAKKAIANTKTAAKEAHQRIEEAALEKAASTIHALALGEDISISAEDLRLVCDTLRMGSDHPSDTNFQSRVAPWLQECFGPKIVADISERCHRFLEEALELVESLGCTADEAHQLVDYVFNLDIGEVNQEVGGVMVTLAALCLATGVDMHKAGETELKRVWQNIDKIRAKQAAKPEFSPLPGSYDGIRTKGGA